jgi:hypothetical protein
VREQDSKYNANVQVRYDLRVTEASQLAITFNPLNAELNPIRHLLALAGARHFVDVSWIRVNVMCLRSIIVYNYAHVCNAITAIIISYFICLH